MKRAVCVILLFSMFLHGASRLGVVHYLFSKRHSIAYSVGLISEIPIATCSGDYLSNHAPLIIKDADDTDERLPSTFSVAKKITFFIQAAHKTDQFACLISEVTYNTAPLKIPCSPPLSAIFHPPCELALA